MSTLLTAYKFAKIMADSTYIREFIIFCNTRPFLSTHSEDYLTEPLKGIVFPTVVPPCKSDYQILGSIVQAKFIVSFHSQELDFTAEFLTSDVLERSKPTEVAYKKSTALERRHPGFKTAILLTFLISCMKANAEEHLFCILECEFLSSLQKSKPRENTRNFQSS